jgi:RHS repeat-associated protein
MISAWTNPTTPQESHIYADGLQIAYRSGDGKTYFVHQNWMGIDRVHTDMNGVTGAIYTSLPFGDGGVDTVGEQYAGWDFEHFGLLDIDYWSNTYHAQYRNYSPTQGRWLSPDPYDLSYDLTKPQSLNRYAYVLNNPLSSTDASGLCENCGGSGGDWTDDSLNEDWNNIGNDIRSENAGAIREVQRICLGSLFVPRSGPRGQASLAPKRGGGKTQASGGAAVSRTPSLSYGKLFFLLLGLFFVLAHPRSVAAQKTKTSNSECLTEGTLCIAEATFDMVASADGTEIDTDSNITNLSTEYLAGVEIEGDLYNDTTGALLNTNDNSGEFSADVPLGASVNTPDTYRLDTIPSVCLVVPEGPCEPVQGPTYPLYINTDYPQVSSISPNSITVGTSGTITVNGQNFIDYFGNNPTPFINNSSVTLSLGSVSDTQANVNYSVTTGAPTGDFGLNLKGLFGNGEPAELAVGDPSPAVTSISPSVWYAGNSYNVTITGTNFGTSPTSSISAAPGVTYSQTGGNDTTITASVTVAPNAPNTDPITVTVTSQGFGGGSGFFSGNGGSPTTSTTAQAVAGAPPAPVINLMNGTTASPFAGQLISLSVSSPTGWTLYSQTWSFLQGNGAGGIQDISGGYTNTAENGPPSATAGGQEAADPSVTQQNIQFYFVNIGTTENVTVTVTYKLADGSISTQATATQAFSIQGPTNVQVATPTNPVVIEQLNNLSLMQFGANATTTPGIAFNSKATAASNPGTFQWVQLISQELLEQMEPTGPYICRPLPLDNDPTHPELDADYPYSTGVATRDSPRDPIGLVPQYGEYSTDNFTATMYLMWDPALPGPCTAAYVTDNPDGTTTDHASTCTSSPIPLGSVQWSWHGCAVNTLQNQTNGTQWALQCPAGAPTGPFQSGGGYPHWTLTIVSGQGATQQCEKE